MHFADLHAWNVTPQEAIALQKQLAPLVETRDRFGPVERVAGGGGLGGG